MKKYIIAFLFGCLAISTAYSQAPNANAAREQVNTQMARTGCQKSLGFFPTPSKIMCVLGAIGKSENQVKPKELAVVFTVCQGHVVPQQVGANTGVKKYATMGACLSDPNAVATINKELTAQGFSTIKVVNPGVLSVGT
jgi:hypothetical protein